MEEIFNLFSSLFQQNIIIASFASFIWGILSVFLSPCHLSGIPLICGYLMNKKGSFKSIFLLSLTFATGVFFSLIFIGGITISLGRLFGDTGILGNLIVSALFIIFGLYLIGVLNFNWKNINFQPKKSSFISVFLMGFIFGIGLGPCTFAYIVPVLGFSFDLASRHIFSSIILVLFFGIGHTLAIAFAGASVNFVQKFLKFNNQSKIIIIIQKTLGVILILIGISYLKNLS